LHQVLTPANGNAGKIEILHGKAPVASLAFQYGRDLKIKPPEIRAKDIYLNSKTADVLMVGQLYRGSGLGAQLLAEMIHYTKQNGGGNIYLRVNVLNKKAMDLYTGFGFKKVRATAPNEVLMAFYTK
jgi:GNAT superfamily N-acetyltransferase